MRSAASAFAWELSRRHRWGLSAVCLYLVALTAIRVFWIEPGQAIHYEERWSFALGVVVPLGSTFMYFLAIFSFGLAGDLGARRSIYPARLFTYPLTNAALIGWPMLYGALAMIGLWLATRQLTLWPSDATVPVVWPALFAAVILAWTQALTWMPYPMRGLRAVLMVLWLAAIAFGALLALFAGASEGLMLALLTPLAALAYLAARVAISRARHGGAAAGQLPKANTRQRPSRPWALSSPMSAQVWLEWRRHGRSLPALIALVIPFELCLLFVFHETPSLVRTTVATALLTPPFLAIFAAATVQRSSRSGADTYELTPFLATRPMTSASLIGAKLVACLFSTLAAWLVVLLALPAGLFLSKTWPIVVESFQRSADIIGPARALGLLVLAIAALVATTWKLLVQSLFLGLSGRPWLVKASVFGSLAVLAMLAPFAPWALKNSRVVFAAVWNALPAALLLLVVAKMSLAAWMVARLAKSRLLPGRWLVSGALLWDAAVLTLYGALLWLAPTILMRKHILLMMAILAVPLARLSAAPLALSWNRHR